MQCLIDADVLLYEIGFAAESGWQQPGFPPWDYVEQLLENRIGNIVAIAGQDDSSPPILYMTGATNFRFDIAKRTPYKARAGNKPWHYKNIKAYLKAKYDVREQAGLEADDLMAIEQTRRNEILDGNPLYSGPVKPSIICTRDKDLRQVPGWHYGWELANQPQFGPMLVDEFGSIALSHDRKSIKGYGLKFFYSQCLTGDRVDSIPGIDKCGPVAAFEILEHMQTPDECFKAVKEAYKAAYGDDWDKELLEQGRLLWMTRELTETGQPVLWSLPDIA
jgi:hypothetical protein